MSHCCGNLSETHSFSSCVFGPSILHTAVQPCSHSQLSSSTRQLTKLFPDLPYSPYSSLHCGDCCCGAACRTGFRYLLYRMSSRNFHQACPSSLGSHYSSIHSAYKEECNHYFGSVSMICLERKIGFFLTIFL